MHGRKREQAIYSCVLLLLTAAGCARLSSSEPPARPAPAAPSPLPLSPVAGERGRGEGAELPSHFDPATAETITGRVTWTGDIPEVAPFRSWVHLTPQGGDKLVRENPHAPRIDPMTKGAGNAVVFLRGVLPAESRPWDHPPVRVEQDDYRLHVRQGETDSPYGFVRRGELVEMVSRQNEFHSLQVRGAAFFTLAFPDPDQPRSRQLQNTGLVELTSGAGYYWMRAYLFVDEHPYYTRTDSSGRFTLSQVPPGNYELVCWMPNWLEDRHERDPETGLVFRHFFREPVKVTRQVRVGKGESPMVEFEVSAGLFRRD